MMTTERRAEIEEAVKELGQARAACCEAETFPERLEGAIQLMQSARHGSLERMARELLAENDQLRHSIDHLKRPIDSYACQRCGRATGLDVVLTNEKWEAISVAAGNLDLLCLWCVDEIADSLGIKASVSLFFAGRAIHGTSQSESDQEHVTFLVDEIERLVEGEPCRMGFVSAYDREIVATTVAELEARISQLTAENARLNELLTSRSELAATTIAGLEMENARLKAECDTLRAALHHREGKAEVGRLEPDA
jgi:regulator of replication initiation timing